MPLVVESVEQVMASLPVTVKVIVADELVGADAARVTVGAVESAPSFASTTVVKDELAVELDPYVFEAMA